MKVDSKLINLYYKEMGYSEDTIYIHVYKLCVYSNNNKGL